MANMTANYLITCLAAMLKVREVETKKYELLFEEIRSGLKKTIDVINEVTQIGSRTRGLALSQIVKASSDIDCILHVDKEMIEKKYACQIHNPFGVAKLMMRLLGENGYEVPDDILETPFIVFTFKEVRVECVCEFENVTEDPNLIIMKPFSAWEHENREKTKNTIDWFLSSVDDNDNKEKPMSIIQFSSPFHFNKNIDIYQEQIGDRWWQTILLWKYAARRQKSQLTSFMIEKTVFETLQEEWCKRPELVIDAFTFVSQFFMSDQVWNHKLFNTDAAFRNTKQLFAKAYSEYEQGNEEGAVLVIEDLYDVSYQEFEGKFLVFPSEFFDEDGNFVPTSI